MSIETNYTNYTINDIAAMAGVSKATISRVLNNSQKVNEKTRERVMEIIEQTGFIPSATARSLSNRDNRIICVLVPEIGNPYFGSAIERITSIADSNNYIVQLYNTQKVAGNELRMLSLLAEQRPSGVIVTPTFDDAKPNELKVFQNAVNEIHAPLVMMDSSVAMNDYDTIFIDNYQCAFNLIDSFVRRGHRKIGIITGDLNSETAHDRYQGYADALQKNNIEVDERFVFQGDFTTATANRITHQFIEDGREPKAVFTTNNLTTIGFLQALYEKGKVLGQDIDCVAFDSVSTFGSVKYSYLDRDPGDIGETAIRMLLERIQQPDIAIRKYYVPVSIVMN